MKEKFNDHDSCYVEIPNEDNKILKYNYGEKPLKVTAIIYADLRVFAWKMHSYQNNLEKSYTEKKTKHIPSRFTQQKTNLIVTKVAIVWKGFVRFKKTRNENN